MTLPVSLLLGFAAILLLLLAWVLRDSGRPTPAESSGDLGSEEESGRSHVTYYAQIQQAIAAEDFAFLASRGSRALAGRVRKERRRIALTYLSCLRHDFLKLWRLARVIASMSPEIAARQEIARLRLGVGFTLRYEMLRLKLRFGFAPLPELGALNQVVSGLAMRLEAAMQALGERAALAAKLASSLDRRGLDTP